MNKFLPPLDIAEKRRKNCKPWLTSFIVCLFGPLAFLFSYRQRRYEYAIVYAGLALSIILIREFFPIPPLTGRLFIPFINWLFYSKYGPIILHGYATWSIANLVKKEAIKKQRRGQLSKEEED